MTPEQVAQLVTEVIGEIPLKTTHLTFGHSSISYDVALPGREIIVRTNANPVVFSGTVHNLSVLRELGLPVANLITHDFTKAHYPAAYIILDKFSGRDLRYELSSMTSAQKRRLAEQMVNYQRKVAKLPLGDGFGYASIGEAAPFTAWRDLVLSETRKNLPETLESPLKDWQGRVFRLTDSFTAYLDGVSPTCFLDDLTIKNVIVQNGELSGLVDFDVVCYGDPLWTLGLTEAAIVFDVGPEHLDYVEELCRAYGLEETKRAVVSWYAALFSLTFLARSNPEETRRLLNALEGWLEPLEN